MTLIPRQRSRDDDPSAWTLDPAGAAFITGLPASAISAAASLVLCNAYGLTSLPTDPLTTVLIVGGVCSQIAVNRANLNPEAPTDIGGTAASSFKLGAILTVAARVLWHCAR